MYPDFKELLSVLNEHRVKYFIVGAYAVSVHAQPRATKDTALGKFGAPLEGLSPADFAEPGVFFRMGGPPVGVDILTEIPGVDFDTAWPRRVDDVVDPASGLKAEFLSADDLIASKLATGRPQDLADVAAIRRAQERPRPRAAKRKRHGDTPESGPDS